MKPEMIKRNFLWNATQMSHQWHMKLESNYIFGNLKKNSSVTEEMVSFQSFPRGFISSIWIYYFFNNKVYLIRLSKLNLSGIKSKYN